MRRGGVIISDFWPQRGTRTDTNRGAQAGVALLILSPIARGARPVLAIWKRSRQPCSRAISPMPPSIMWMVLARHAAH